MYFLNQENDVLKFIGTEIWPVLKWILLAIISGIGAVFGWQRKEISTLYEKNEKLQKELVENSEELYKLKTANELFKVRLANLERSTQKIAKTEKITKILPDEENQK